MSIGQVDVRRYRDAAAAHAVAIAALQAKAEAMRATDPATLNWGHAGSAAALANRLVELANEGRR